MPLMVVLLLVLVVVLLLVLVLVLVLGVGWEGPPTEEGRGCWSTVAPQPGPQPASASCAAPADSSLDAETRKGTKALWSRTRSRDRHKNCRKGNKTPAVGHVEPETHKVCSVQSVLCSTDTLHVWIDGALQQPGGAGDMAI